MSIAALVATVALFPIASPKVKAENVIFLFTDGLRWQELFGGADPELMKAAKPTDSHYKAFWRDTPAERRAALMPFVWSKVAKDGQLWGNQWEGSVCMVKNGLKFSYPGYSESIQGFVDPTIRSNDPIPNKNVTVFEWLHKQPGMKDKVAVFGNWYVVNAIVNKARCGFYVQSGMDPITFSNSPEARMLNDLQRDTDHPYGPSDPADAFTYQASLMYLKTKKPRVMGVLFGETDSWAHSGKYDKYLNSAHRFDQWVKGYWDAINSMPQYRGKTALIITTDHGRGDGAEWTSHGEKINKAEYTWIMAMGPDTPGLGERKNAPEVNNGQVAASIAALIGFDYRASQPKAERVLADLIK